MKIVVLNECFLKDEHLSRLRKLGDVEVFTDTSTEDQAIERLKNADIAIVDCFLTPMNDKFFESIPTVKFISINSIGYDSISISGAKKAKISISNIPGYSAQAVAEHAIALMFALVRNVIPFGNVIKSGIFEVDPADESMHRYLGFDFAGKTFGVVGLGNIGQRVARLASGLGMEVIAYNRSLKSVKGVELVSLDELLKRADIVSIHTPLNPDSEKMIGKNEFLLMKESAIIINTSRGKVIDEDALITSLQSKKLAGAGLDIVVKMDKDNPLLSMENVVVTPHIAWYTKESFQNLANMVVENVEAFEKGEPKNLII